MNILESKLQRLTQEQFQLKDPHRRRRLDGHPLQVRHKQDWGRGLILLLLQAAVLLGSDAAVMLLSQHRVSSSKTVRPRAPCDNQCMGHAIRTRSAVCLEAPQFGEGARPHLCMNEWNRATPVRRRLSLTQAVRGKFIPTGLALVLGIKTQSLEVFSQYSAFHLWFVHSEARIPSPARLFKRFHAAGTNGCLDLNLSWQASEDPFKRPYKI